MGGTVEDDRNGIAPRAGGEKPRQKQSHELLMLLIRQYIFYLCKNFNDQWKTSSGYTTR